MLKEEKRPVKTPKKVVLLLRRTNRLRRVFMLRK
jgi:hypothetical protein